MLTTGTSTPGSGTPTISFPQPQPQRNWTAPNSSSPPTSHTLRPVLSDTALSSRGSSSVNLAAIANQKVPPPAMLQELVEGLDYQEGEMPVSCAGG
jgi:hypothetical protein